MSVIRSTTVVCVVLSSTLVAHAENFGESDGEPTQAPAAQAPAADHAFTAGLSHAAGHGRGLATVATSYSDASRKTTVDLAGEVQVWGPVRLVLRVDNVFDHGRPGIGAAAQWLSEEKHGVASSLYLTYKAEGFTEGEGELEALVAFGKQLGAVHGTLNLAYGQDPEGNERDGEAALGLHVQAMPGLYAGVVGRVRDALGSNGDKATGVLRDFVGGASATYAFDRFGVTATAGFSGVKTTTSDGMKTGPAAALTVGAVF